MASLIVAMSESPGVAMLRKLQQDSDGDISNVTTGSNEADRGADGPVAVLIVVCILFCFIW